MVINFVLALFFSWLIALTFIIWGVKKHYTNLVTRTRRKTIDEILDQLLQVEQTIVGEQKKIQKELAVIRDKMQQCYQKIGVVRFNAFGKTEGEQSFVIALLNEKNDGIVINFIYIHEGIRVYTKNIKNGKSEKHELSDEEAQAIRKAE